MKKKIPLNQCLIFAAGLYLTFAFGMLNFMFLSIHVIYLQYFKQSADTFKHINVDMKHDDQVILVIKNIVFFYEILFYLSIRCPLILTKKLKAHMSTVDGKQYVINTHEAVCHTLLKKSNNTFVIFGLKSAMSLHS